MNMLVFQILRVPKMKQKWCRNDEHVCLSNTQKHVFCMEGIANLLVLSSEKQQQMQKQMQPYQPQAGFIGISIY